MGQVRSTGERTVAKRTGLPVLIRTSLSIRTGCLYKVKRPERKKQQMDTFVIFKEWRSFSSLETLDNMGFVDSDVYDETHDLDIAIATAMRLNRRNACYWDADPDTWEVEAYECIYYSIACQDEDGDTVAWIEPEDMGFDLKSMPEDKRRTESLRIWDTECPCGE